MTQLTICNTSIRQDSSGRYCLNDLHKAAGGGHNERPPLFIARKETAALLDACLESLTCAIAPLRSVHGGPDRGTYVVKELVYAYAMWISPRFHLQVIRAYDALVTQPAVVPAHALAPVFKAPGTLREALLLALAQEEQIEALGAANLKLEHQTLQLAHQVSEDAPKVLTYETVIADKEMSIAAVAKMHDGLNTNRAPSDLQFLGYIYPTNLVSQAHSKC